MRHNCYNYATLLAAACQQSTLMICFVCTHSRSCEHAAADNATDAATTLTIHFCCLVSHDLQQGVSVSSLCARKQFGLHRTAQPLTHKSAQRQQQLTWGVCRASMLLARPRVLLCNLPVLCALDLPGAAAAVFMVPAKHYAALCVCCTQCERCMAAG
jgi:hypothetical protein